MIYEKALKQKFRDTDLEWDRHCRLDRPESSKVGEAWMSVMSADIRNLLHTSVESGTFTHVNKLSVKLIFLLFSKIFLKEKGYIMYQMETLMQGSQRHVVYLG